jgi:NADH-quinone oxidoreductase subunit F
MGEDLLDQPLDYDSMKAIKHFFGTGTAIVLDDKTCPVAVAHNLVSFYARESCGWCTPCREGIPWLRDILRNLEDGKGKTGDVDMLLAQARILGPNTYCAFALGAVTPLISAIEMFRDDFDAHVSGHGCPYESI